MRPINQVSVDSILKFCRDAVPLPNQMFSYFLIQQIFVSIEDLNWIFLNYGHFAQICLTGHELHLWGIMMTPLFPLSV